jgi:hypothetical protein
MAIDRSSRLIRRVLAMLALGATCMLSPGLALAHGFGARYDLPIPLSMYIWGAAWTVGLSFVVAGLFMHRFKDSGAGRSVDMLRVPVLRGLAHPVVLEPVRAVVVALFLLVIAAGFFGTQDPFKNIAPTTVWVIWWVGMAYVSALLGDLWALINPLATMFRWAEAGWRAATGGELSRNRPWPAGWGMWPAVILFFVFAWSELVWAGADVPASLAAAMSAYAVITWLGMARYGRRTWLAHGEVFACVFGLLARFAPTQAVARDGRPQWHLRPPAIGLLVERPVHSSLTCLAVLVLATVSFDGFAETSAWKAVLQWALTTPDLSGLLFNLQGRGIGPVAVLTTTALIVVPTVFFAVFVAVCALMGAAVRVFVPDSPLGWRSYDTPALAGLFVLTLVPISVAYHLAHYLSFLAIAGQYAIPLVSDPFGYGWDLFGTKLYFINLAVINARIVWFVSVTAIVLGHVIAVYLAHRMALRVFGDSRAALVSQVPMVVLMVGYTMVSLWIIAQPIVSE